MQYIYFILVYLDYKLRLWELITFIVVWNKNLYGRFGVEYTCVWFNWTWENSVLDVGFMLE